ncbi:MAG: GAF domain-containing protein, partial [Anaerolineales bacterium]
MTCLVQTRDGKQFEYGGRQAGGASHEQVVVEGTAPLENKSIKVPLQVGEMYVGELIITSMHANGVLEDSLSLIQGIANQAALAIENARLIAEHKRDQQDAERREAELRVRERYLSLLNEITRTTLKTQEFQAMLQSLVEYLGKLLEADSVLIILWEPTRKQMTPAAAYGPLRQVYRSIQLEANDLPLVMSVLNAARTLEVRDTGSTPYISTRLSSQLQIKSLLAVPLVADNQKLGVAMVTFKNEHEFSQREISLAEQAANQLVLTIAKYRAMDALQHRTQELSALQKATSALLTTLDLEVLLGQILDAAISAIPAAEKGTLHLVARDTGQLQLRAVQGYTDPRIRTFNPTDSASFPANAVRERKPLLIHDAHADPDTRYGSDIPEIRAISSMIIAPLILGGRTLGAISLDAYRRYAFTDSDLQLLVSFAATATTAIQNAQLYSEVQRQAITDPLTGLYNRRGFFELGRREVERANRFTR